MRIRKIYVRSFGPLLDKEMAVSPGLNVVFGPNGCGKTSLAEFIGTCLAPTDHRDRYPARSKDDSGTVSMHEHDSETVVTIRGRSRFGRVPDCVRGISPELYRTVFSISRESLADLEPLSPTADGYNLSLHRAAEAMRRTERSVMDAEDGTESELEAIDREIEENDEAIDVLMEEVKRYGEYASQKKAVTERLIIESDDSMEAEEKRRYDRLRETHKSDYENLERLTMERVDLGNFEWAGNTDEATYLGLRKELEESSEKLESLEEYMNDPISELGSRDASSILFYADEITWLADMRRDYERQSNDLRRCRTELAKAKMGPDKRKGGMFGRPDRSSDISRLTDEASDLARRTEAYERMVSRITSGLGITATEAAHAVAELVRLRDAASIVSKHGDELKEAQDRARSSEEEMRRFLEAYGGEDVFLECLDKTKAAKRIDEQITKIRSALSKDGLDPDTPVCPVEYIGVATGVEGLKRRLEDLDSKMARIMDSEELESLIDRRSVLASRRNAIVKRGIDAAIGCAMAKKVDARALCSSEAEWEGAESLLSMMTEEECSIRYDDGFVMSCKGVERPLNGTGSGMKSMAALALKISAAERIGEDKVPIVLDEVLAGMDSKRKASACMMLREVAKRVQVIILTGDQETRDILAVLSDVTIINLTQSVRMSEQPEDDTGDAGTV